MAVVICTEPRERQSPTHSAFFSRLQTLSLPQIVRYIGVHGRLWHCSAYSLLFWVEVLLLVGSLKGRPVDVNVTASRGSVYTAARRDAHGTTTPHRPG